MSITIKNASHRPFWRGGALHPPGERTYPDGHFGAGQLAAIEAEPLLTVTKSAGAATPAPKPAKKKAAQA